jgi:hypothetical protein
LNLLFLIKTAVIPPEKVPHEEGENQNDNQGDESEIRSDIVA